MSDDAFEFNYPPTKENPAPSGFAKGLAPKETKDEPGKTYDAGKLRFDLIPPEWETALAAVMTKGAEKYAPHNWQKGLSWSRRYGSIRRHLNAFWAGEDNDAETDLPHLAHAAWGCLAILTFMRTHKEFDDRVPKL